MLVYIKPNITKVLAHYELGVWEFVQPFLVADQPDKRLAFVRISIHFPQVKFFHLSLEEGMVRSEDAPDNIDSMRAHTYPYVLLGYQGKLLLNFTCVPVLCRLVRPDYAISHGMMRSGIGLLACARRANFAVHHNVACVYEVIFNKGLYGKK